MNDVDATAKNRSTLEYIQDTARKFLDRETAGGLLLIAATILALIIGNSSWSEVYHHLLVDEFLFEMEGHFSFGLEIEKWINDGLMALFFVVAGLELKREVLVGELSSVKKASMPMLAALGGMAIPASIYFFLNTGTDTAHGWGVPMATDIAYSLGIVGLLGKRVPTQLKVFLVALAIADDLGAILVIAFFYSSDISWVFLALAAGVLVILLILNHTGVKSLLWFILCGIALWYCFLNSGVHPTIAGILFALTIPVKPGMNSKNLKERAVKHVKELEQADVENLDPMQDLKQQRVLQRIKKDTERSAPPLLRLENSLSGFNAFVILPLFALANAGVKLDIALTEVLSQPLGLGIVLGLALGKVTGVTLFTFIGQKLGISQLPSTLKWQHIIGMGMIAGIGFTMSLFITNLAFSDEEMVKISKISILLASLIAALGGVVILLISGRKDEGREPKEG